MNKFLFLIITASLFVSCDRNDLPNANVGKIPIDSVYISFKIDGEEIVLQSPTTTRGSQEYSLARLRKLPNNAVDSMIYGREYTYWTDNYIINVGFSKCLLLDTILMDDFSIPNFQSELFETGDGALQFYPPPVPIRSVTSYYSGFYISIRDKRTSTSYKSYVEKSNLYDNLNLWDIFNDNSSFKIVSSRQLNTGIYSDYLNTWFLESNFECALFTNDISNPQISNFTKKITEGVIRGCF
jgi:hypothetical protein